MPMFFAAWWVCVGWLDRESSSGPPATECTVGRAHSSQGCEKVKAEVWGCVKSEPNIFRHVCVSITRRRVVPCARRGLMCSPVCPAGKRMRCRTGGGTEPPPPAVSLRQGGELSPRPKAPPWGQDHEILLPRKMTLYPMHVQAREAESARCTLRFPCTSVFPSAASSTNGLVKTRQHPNPEALGSPGRPQRG